MPVGNALSSTQMCSRGVTYSRGLHEHTAPGGTAQVRCSYLIFTVKADVSTLQSAADLYTAGIAPIQSSGAGLVASFSLSPYPLSLLEQSSNKGGNSLGLNLEETGPVVFVLVLAHWSDQSDDETVGETIKGILESIRNVAGGKKTDVQFIFLNYASVLELDVTLEPLHVQDYTSFSVPRSHFRSELLLLHGSRLPKNQKHILTLHW